MAILPGAACALAVTVLLATPVASQDTSAAQEQLVYAYTACFSEAGDPDLTSSIFTAFDWTREDASDDGMIHFYPPGAEDPYVAMAEDGSFCDVESATVDTATASDILASSLSVVEFEISQEDMGCPKLEFANGAVATITASGDELACTSDVSSAVSFYFGEM